MAKYKRITKKKNKTLGPIRIKNLAKGWATEVGEDNKTPGRTNHDLWRRNVEARRNCTGKGYEKQFKKGIANNKHNKKCRRRLRVTGKKQKQKKNKKGGQKVLSGSDWICRYEKIYEKKHKKYSALKYGATTHRNMRGSALGGGAVVEFQKTVFVRLTSNCRKI